MEDKPLTNIIRQVRFLEPDDKLAKVISVLRASQTHAAPVTHNGRIHGLVTEQAMLARLSAGSDDDCAVADIMDRNPPCANVYMTISQAADMMNRTGEDVLPVIDEFGGYRGIVTRSDVLAAQLNVMRPPMVAGMATPLGVHLTTGSIAAGAGHLGLYLAGVALMLMIEVSRALIGLSALAIDKLFSTNLILMAASPATGQLTWAAIRVDAIQYVLLALQIGLMLVLLRLSPMSGYHAAEHQVVHTIEAGEPLTPETVAGMPRAHPRCGTNLMAGLALFLVIASVIGTQVGLLVAVIIVLLGWRTLGYYLQQYFTTKPPAEKHILNGIKVGEELLAKYSHEPNKPVTGWSRIWYSGILQVAMGFATVFALDQWLFSGLPGFMVW